MAAPRCIPRSWGLHVTHHRSDREGSPGAAPGYTRKPPLCGNDSQRTGRCVQGRVYFNHSWDPHSEGSGSRAYGAHSPRFSLPAASNAALPCPLPAVGEEREGVRKEGLPNLRGVLHSTQEVRPPQFPLSLPRERGRQTRSPFPAGGGDGLWPTPTHLRDLM